MKKVIMWLMIIALVICAYIGGHVLSNALHNDTQPTDISKLYPVDPGTPSPCGPSCSYMYESTTGKYYCCCNNNGNCTGAPCPYCTELANK